MKDKMDIYIPTLGRATFKQQETLRQLLEASIFPTLVVQAHEADQYDWYKDTGPVYVLPSWIKTITPTRDHIIHDIAGKSNKVLMLDDDLHFAVRREDDPSKFRQPATLDTINMVNAIADSLDHFPHVGIGAREGGNRQTAERVLNTRIMRVLAYRRDLLKQNHVTFAPMEVMEDFHVTLQLLRLGYDVCVENRWVSNQAAGSGAAGGCSTFRTPELHARNAKLLMERHPGFVKLVKKTTKGAWGGGERTDVVIQWKRARAYS